MDIGYGAAGNVDEDAARLHFCKGIGVEKTGGMSVSVTTAGNTVKSADKVITTIYGRQGTETGLLEIAGGTYETYPIEENVEYAAPKDGYIIFENADGKYGVKEGTYVAQINGVKYETLASALAAAQNDAVVELLWAEGNAPIAMNGSVYGKSVTITGTATVDWSKGWLFVGRGGEGDGTVIFDNAKLTSTEASLKNGSYGIHVSAPENGSTTKCNGTVIIQNNSDIQLSYLANRHNVTVDNSRLYVEYGFWVGGRPSGETPDSQPGIANMELVNNSTVTVKNHNGMGVGHESIGNLAIEVGSTFEYLNDAGLRVKANSSLVSAGNFFQEKDATIKLYVDAVQRNADTKDTDAVEVKYITTVKDSTELKSKLYELRISLNRSLEQICDAESSALYSGILLGDKTNISDEKMLLMTSYGCGKRVDFDEFMRHGRATGGQKGYNVTDKTGEVVGVISVTENDEIYLDEGQHYISLYNIGDEFGYSLIDLTPISAYDSMDLTFDKTLKTQKGTVIGDWVMANDRINFGAQKGVGYVDDKYFDGDYEINAVFGVEEFESENIREDF